MEFFESLEHIENSSDTNITGFFIKLKAWPKVISMHNVISLKFLLKLYPNQKVAPVGFRSTGIRPFVSKGDDIGYNIVIRNEIQIFWIPYVSGETLSGESDEFFKK